MPWSDPLAFPIKLRDGRELHTLREAGELIASLGEAAQRHPWVDYAAELLVKAAKRGTVQDIKHATAQMCAALRREGMI